MCRTARGMALFPEDGPVTKGWLIRTWADVKDAPKAETIWDVQDGVLHGGKSPTGQWVGTWLFSEREYGAFILEVDFKFKNGGATGNGGLALPSPLQGRPSFDGFEPQITDPRSEFSLYPEGNCLSRIGEQLLFKNARIAVLD